MSTHLCLYVVVFECTLYIIMTIICFEIGFFWPQYVS